MKVSKVVLDFGRPPVHFLPKGVVLHYEVDAKDKLRESLLFGLQAFLETFLAVAEIVEKGFSFDLEQVEALAETLPEGFDAEVGHGLEVLSDYLLLEVDLLPDFFDQDILLVELLAEKCKVVDDLLMLFF